MEEQARVLGQWPARGRAREHVHVVSAAHEPGGQLGGDDAAAAERGITDHRDRELPRGRAAIAGRLAANGGATHSASSRSENSKGSIAASTRSTNARSP